MEGRKMKGKPPNLDVDSSNAPVSRWKHRRNGNPHPLRQRHPVAFTE